MLKLKISSYDVPRRVPFSVVYLYKKEERETIRAAFPALFELRPYQLRKDAWHLIRIAVADDAEYPTTIRALDGVTTAMLHDVIPDLFAADSPWYMAVPTLVTSSTAATKQRIDDLYAIPAAAGQEEAPSEGTTFPIAAPSYLGHPNAGNWVKPPAKKQLPPYADPHVLYDPTLAVQGRPDVGVCSSCPRYAHNAAGLCFFGDPVCKKHVVALGAPTFTTHLAESYRGESDGDIHNG